MAGDWIKMRVWLSRDPKVIFMADRLATEREFMRWLTDPVQQSCKESAYEHVTRDVTVALCVTSLLIIWGTAREQGHRDGDDLVLSCCDVESVSAVCGVPGFGNAMVITGWLTAERNNQVRFPKFFTAKNSPEERHRSPAAERQKRYREKHRNGSNGVSDVTRDTTRDITRDVTVTHRREEKRRSTPIVPALFARFWSAYPKRVSKRRAVKAWSKLNPGEQLTSEILQAVERAKTSEEWRREGGRFIPHPATWLNNGGWEDEQPAAHRQQLAL